MSYSDDQEVLAHIHRVRQREDVIRAAQHSELDKVDADDEEREDHFRSTYDERIVNALEECAESLRSLKRDYALANTRAGQVYGNIITINTASTPIKIDLVRPALSEGLGSQVLFLPFRPLVNLTLINTGTGTLNFSFPKRRNEWPQYASLAPPAANTNPVPLYFDFKQPTLERINLLATGGNVILNMMTLL
jgi:hypothetical protein